MTSKIFCNSILYLKIVISNKLAKPLIIKNFFSNHSFAAIQVFFFISRFQTSIHRYLCIRFQQFLTDNSIFKHTLKKNWLYILSKLLLGHIYRTLKTNIVTPDVVYVTFFH